MVVRGEGLWFYHGKVVGGENGQWRDYFIQSEVKCGSTHTERDIE